MKIIKGIPASSGKVAGKTFRLKKPSSFNETENLSAFVSTELEIRKFLDSSAEVKERLRSHLNENRIFAAHIEILDDITDRVISTIERGEVDAICAIKETCTETVTLFAGIEDEYLRARSDDIVDVCQQLISTLTKHHENPFSSMPTHCIIIADNLLVSDTALIDKSKLAGIALRKGSSTSHVAILIREYEIPLIVGIGQAIETIPDDATVMIDGDTGEIIFGFEGELLPGRITDVAGGKEDKAPVITKIVSVSYHNEKEKDGNSPAIAKDEVKVYANTGSLADVEKAISLGADGIGILRTEFLFMHETCFPDEDRQYEIYLACAKACGEKTITIRTLDTGADKQLPYITMEKEENPVLGLRGIRFSLAYPDIFKVQLRAILRASILGNVRVLLPMITSLDEYKSASALLEECKSELNNEGIAFDDKLRPGIMIETPASVLLADDFAQHAAFFSIGVNDLTQYILAVDRDNPYAASAYDQTHSAVLKSIAQVMAASRKYGIDASVCGEIASDLRATELLLNLGVRNLSVASRRVPLIKEHILSADFGSFTQ